MTTKPSTKEPKGSVKTRISRLFNTRKSPLTDFVWDNFVAPLEKIFPSREDALGAWLGLKYRDIYFCKCDEPFTMPGLEQISGPKFQPGTVNREVKRGQSVLVRIDKRTPELVDVDLNIGEDVRTFRLTTAEYQLIAEKVEVLY